MNTPVRFGAICLLGFGVACVDPEGKLDDFSERVIDAGEDEDVDAAAVDDIPDATGTYLAAFIPSLLPSETVQFLAEVEVEDDGEDPTLSISMQPLDTDTREPVGDEASAEDVSIDGAARFSAVLAEFPPDSEGCDPEPDNPVVIPADASPVGSELALTVTLSGAIVTDELLCGDVEAVEFGTLGCEDLDGSTFGMIRVDDDVDPADLPEPLGSCPDD